MADFTTLIDTATLAQHLDAAHWRVFDCRFDLADTGLGRREYLAAHIPGAIYADLDQHLSTRRTRSQHPHEARHGFFQDTDLHPVPRVSAKNATTPSAQAQPACLCPHALDRIAPVHLCLMGGQRLRATCVTL